MSSTIQRNEHARGTPSWRRGLWVLMALVHFPALISCCKALALSSAAAPLDSCALLSLSVLFFALKAVDVRCLRFDASSARSRLTIATAVLFLHAGVLSPPLAEGSLERPVPLAAAVLLSSQVPALRRALARAAAARAPRGWSPRRLERPLPTAPALALASRRDALRPFAPRPPPLVG